MGTFFYVLVLFVFMFVIYDLKWMRVFALASIVRADWPGHGKTAACLPFRFLFYERTAGLLNTSLAVFQFWPLSPKGGRTERDVIQGWRAKVTAEGKELRCLPHWAPSSSSIVSCDRPRKTKKDRAPRAFEEKGGTGKGDERPWEEDRWKRIWRSMRPPCCLDGGPTQTYPVDRSLWNIHHVSLILPLRDDFFFSAFFSVCDNWPITICVE